MDLNAAAEALNRQQLAEQGQTQVLQLMRSGKHLLDTYSQLQPTTDAQQRLQEVQQKYLKAAADVQATLQQCQVLQQQEQAAAAGGCFRAVGMCAMQQRGPKPALCATVLIRLTTKNRCRC